MSSLAPPGPELEEGGKGDELWLAWRCLSGGKCPKADWGFEWLSLWLHGEPLGEGFPPRRGVPATQLLSGSAGLGT